ncbi:MAG: hypothetical protein FD189_1936 [Elusimicrobia bacterium]|nr:MAG: hypothetical protein FD189_1936 [Elusimicrobiota bacterium]
MLRVLLPAALFAAYQAGPVLAGDSPGLTSANFLKIPVAAMPAALGESYTALIGPDSALYNPGALGLLGYSAFSGSHNTYLAGITQEYAALSLRTRYGTAGFSFSSLSSGGITAYDDDDQIIGETETSHRVAAITFAQSWPNFPSDIGMIDPMIIPPSWTRIQEVRDYRPRSYRFAAGATVKRIMETLDDDSSAAWAADAGVMLVLPGRVQLGASVLNLGTSQDFHSESAALPSSFRFGLAKDFHTVKELMVFTLAADAVKYRDAGLYQSFGLEVDILRFLQVRAGHKTIENAGAKSTVGFGFNFDKFTETGFLKGIRVDYANIGYGELGSTNRIGLQAVW